MDSYLLNIDLNVLLQVVAVEVEDQVVDKVETITDDDEWQLVSEFGFLFVTHSEGKEDKLSKTPTKKNQTNKKTKNKTLLDKQQNINQPRCNRADLLPPSLEYCAQW